MLYVQHSFLDHWLHRPASDDSHRSSLSVLGELSDCSHRTIGCGDRKSFIQQCGAKFLPYRCGAGCLPPPHRRRHHLTQCETAGQTPARSEEHTSELQSLMRISYAVFCLKKKQHNNNTNTSTPKRSTSINEKPHHTRAHVNKTL